MGAQWEEGSRQGSSKCRSPGVGDAPERPPATPLTPASELPFHLHVEVLGLEEAEVKAVQELLPGGSLS